MAVTNELPRPSLSHVHMSVAVAHADAPAASVHLAGGAATRGAVHGAPSSEEQGLDQGEVGRDRVGGARVYRSMARVLQGGDQQGVHVLEQALRAR